MLANKDPAAIIALLADRLASLTVVPVPGHDHHGADAFGPGAKAAASVAAALRGPDLHPTREIVLFAGSLSLAGQVLRANRELPESAYPLRHAPILLRHPPLPDDPPSPHPHPPPT